MKAQVLELGGDTLLFGERGRAQRVRSVPSEIVERRNELLTVDQRDGAAQPAAEVPSDPPSAVASGALWYYGAALRCNDRPSPGEGA